MESSRPAGRPAGEGTAAYQPVRSYDSGATTSAPSSSGHRSTSCLHELVVCLTGARNGGVEANGRNVVYDFLKSVVLGGIDGLLAAVAIISGAAGGGLPWQYSLIVGFAGLAAGSISYALGEFLSFKNQREYILLAKRTKMYELKNGREAEMAKIVQKFVKKGVAASDAEAIVARMAPYEAFFVSYMVSEELGTSLDDDDASLLTDAFVNVLSFASIGGLPLLVFCLAAPTGASDRELYYAGLGVAAAASFVLGTVKNHFVFHSYWWYLGLEAAAVVCVCAAVSFSVGRAISTLL